MRQPWKRLIDGRQLALLLFVGRMSAAAAWAPGAAAGPVQLAAQLPALGLELGLLAPAFWVLRRAGRPDLLGCARCSGKGAGLAAAALGWLFCVVQAARAIDGQARFLAGTAGSPFGGPGMYFALWAVMLYMAWLGLEAVARLSLGAAVGFAAALAALGAFALPRLDALNLAGLLRPGAELGRAGLNYALDCGQVGMAILLAPAVRGPARRWGAAACALWSGGQCLLIGLTLAALGRFAALQAYPVYALAAAGSELTLANRAGALFSAGWMLPALVQGAAVLWLGAGCAQTAVSCGSAACFLATGGAALACAAAARLTGGGWLGLAGRGTLAAVALAVPLLALPGARRKGVPHET